MMRKALSTTVLCAVLAGGMAIPSPALAGGRPGTEETPGPEMSALTVAALNPAAAAALKPALAKGSRGPAVVFVQQELGVTPTSGYYGPLTRKAVKKLQKRNNLTPTGKVSETTWRILLSGQAGTQPTPSTSTDPGDEPNPGSPSLTPEQAAATRPALSRGMGPGNPAVIFVQEYLNVSPATGYYGTLTTAAVTAYQMGLSLAATGAVDGPTWDAILTGRTVTPPVPAVTQSPSAPTIPTPVYRLPARPTAADRAVVFALAQVGKPYVLGGNGPDVFDCSGLIQQAYLSAGVSLPRLASQQRFAGTEVTLDELAPGDLLYYQDGPSPRNGHISMYAGNGLAVEAANPRRGVRVRALNEPWYRDRFVAATRVG